MKAVAITILITIGCLKSYSMDIKQPYKQFVIEELDALKKAETWLNTTPLTAAQLKGKVVLIEFGTYTCINWIRTLPYVRAWAEKYKAKGLEVIQIHTPEFPFEKNIENVRQAIKDMQIGFPIAIDNKMEIWNAFNNHYWPAMYFIDGKGRVRHYRFGEGGYAESEKVIQQLLAEAGAEDIPGDLVTGKAEGVEAAADWNSLQSQENYLGYERTENFARRLVPGRQNDYKATAQLQPNQWALSGAWTVGKGSIISNKENGRIVYRFHARDLHMVMGPAVAGSPVRFRVLIDGEPPVTAHGMDVDEQGNGIVTGQRMYQLIRQTGPIADHTFEIEFLDTGAEAFSFTFG
jgi:thiol-disulfide isomerase/thioredoxin